MKEQDKQLLLKDLCARLPYDVIVNDGNEIDTLKAYMLDDLMFIDEAIIRPYLRSMSSMTDEEENEYRAINCYEGLFPRNEDALDYALEYHLDFRNLIGKGLALEAKEGMYKNEC